jgi:hypothetical protein
MPTSSATWREDISGFCEINRITFKRISACCSSRRLAKIVPHNGYRTEPRVLRKLNKERIAI